MPLPASLHDESGHARPLNELIKKYASEEARIPSGTAKIYERRYVLSAYIPAVLTDCYSQITQCTSQWRGRVRDLIVPLLGPHYGFRDGRGLEDSKHNRELHALLKDKSTFTCKVVCGA